MTLTLNTNTGKKGADLDLVRSDQFVNIWGFMIKDLGLEKTELLVYAMIFSYYKHRADVFDGSRRYLQAWTNAGKTSVENALASLEKKKLIIKELRPFGPCTKAVYYINTEILPTHDMFEPENRNRDNNEKIRKMQKYKEYGIY